MCLESGKGTNSNSLRLISMDRRSRNTIAIQSLYQTIGSIFGARKNQNLCPVITPNEMT